MITAIIWLLYFSLGAIYNRADSGAREADVAQALIVFSIATTAAILATIVVNR